MSRVLKITDQAGLYFTTFTVIHWIDLFTRLSYKNLLLKSLKHCQVNKGLRVHAFVIMTSHVHLILSAKKESVGLSAIIRDFKKFTSGELIRAIKDGPESRREWLLRAFSKAGQSNPNNKNYQIWLQDNHPVELLTVKFIVQKMNYIHNNPVHEGTVFSPTDYVFSSATAYAGREVECPLDIDLLDVPLF